MNTNTSSHPGILFRLSGIILIICAVYFFMMGCGLIFLPHQLVSRFDPDVNSIVIGMLRGAGGSILPYALLYILVYLDPLKRLWVLPVILFANLTAIALDIVSLLLEEYKFSYAMYDIPVEVLSITALWIIWSKRTPSGK